MNTIIELNKEQFLVELNSIIYTNKLDYEVNEKITITNVLYNDGVFGAPFLTNVYVTFIVEKQDKCKKIIVQKYRPKKNYKKKMGFRKCYTRVKILEIKTIPDKAIPKSSGLLSPTVVIEKKLK